MDAFFEMIEDKKIPKGAQQPFSPTSDTALAKTGVPAINIQRSHVLKRARRCVLITGTPVFAKAVSHVGEKGC